MIWAVFFCRTHACRDIYTYTNERETDFNEVSQIRTYPGTTQCHGHFETNLAYHPFQKRKVQNQKGHQFFVYVDPDQTLSNPSRSNCIQSSDVVFHHTQKQNTYIVRLYITIYCFICTETILEKITQGNAQHTSSLREVFL